jgi:hypothetical protein
MRTSYLLGFWGVANATHISPGIVSISGEGS